MMPMYPSKRSALVLCVLALIVGVQPAVVKRQTNIGRNQRPGNNGSVDMDAILNKVMMDFLQSLNRSGTTTPAPTAFGARVRPPDVPSGQFLQDSSGGKTASQRQISANGHGTDYYRKVSSPTGPSPSTIPTVAEVKANTVKSPKGYLPNNRTNSMTITTTQKPTVLRNITMSPNVGQIGENKSLDHVLSFSTAAAAITTTTTITTNVYSTTNATTTSAPADARVTNLTQLTTASGDATTSTAEGTTVSTLTSAVSNSWKSLGSTTNPESVVSAKTLTTILHETVSSNTRNTGTGFSTAATSSPKTEVTSLRNTAQKAATTASAVERTEIVPNTTSTTMAASFPTVTRPNPVLSNGEPKNWSLRVGPSCKLQTAVIFVLGCLYLF